MSIRLLPGAGLAFVLLLGCGTGGSSRGGPLPAPGDAAANPPGADAAAGAGADGGVAGLPAMPTIPPICAADASPAAPPGGPGPTRPRPFFPRAGANAAAAQAIVDGFSEEQWRNLVPQQSPRDPGAVGALERCRPPGAVRYAWDAKDPDHITFFDAAGAALGTFPSDGDGRTYLSVAVLSGGTVMVPVWNLGPSASSCPLQQIIDHEKDAYLRGRLNTLAAAYADPSTRQEAFARRIAIALDEWARRLPDYYLTGKNGIRPLNPPEALAMGDIQRVSDHNGVAHEVREEPVTAFDAIYDSPALAELSAQLGRDVRQTITDGYFLNLMDYITNKIPLAVHVATNLSGSFDETARIATILHRPELARWLNEYLAQSVQNLVRDGMLPESIGYASGYLNENRSVATNLRTYFQVWPASEGPLADIARASEAYLGAFVRGLAALDSVAMPDGTMAPFGNTPFRRGRPRTETRSLLLPGYGQVVLGDGQQAEQVQVNLAFNDNANHCEQDVLHFTLFGFERELLSDLRYARMPGRPFTESTLAHNTVTVDRRDQYRSNNQVAGNRGHLFTGGDLLLYEPNLAGLSVAELDGSQAYAGTVSRYQRLLILNARDSARPYVIDLFRVTGGQTHDYFIHGATLFDMTTAPPDPAAPAGASSLPLVRMEGAYPLLEGSERFVEPPQDDEPWYGAFRDVWSARSNGNWNVTFASTEPPQAVRITMLDEGDLDVFVAKSPSPHRDRMPPDTPEAFYGHWRPSLLARHRGAGPLDSLFVAVIEPLRGPPAVAQVERLPLAGGRSLDQVALRVSLADGAEDVVLVDLANPAVTGRPPGGRFATADGRYALDGRLGMTSRRPDGERSYLVAGTRFEHAGQTTTLDPGLYAGALTELVSLESQGCGPRGFVTDVALPAGGALAGRFLKVTFDRYAVVPSGASYPAGQMEQRGITQMYRIDRVERSGGRTVIVLADDPMLTMKDGVAQETTRPGRRFTGPFTFEISSGVAR